MVLELPRPAAPSRTLPQNPIAINPMVLHGRMLLAVLDTNALLIEACSQAKHNRPHHPLAALAGTRRATLYVAPHVLEEIDEHLPKMARTFGVPTGAADAALREHTLPLVRVVDLEIRDHLAPGTRHILRRIPGLPKAQQGDPDDAPTMALAELLGPSVLFTRDKVFERFGLAVMDSLTVAQTLLRTAGLEANGANAVLLAGYVLEASAAGIGKLVDVAARRPELTAAAVAGALWYLWRTGRLTAGWRPLLSGLWDITESVLQVVADAKQEHADLSGTLTVVEATAFPSVEQSAARCLARHSRPLTAVELRDALADRDNVSVSAARLRREMRAHRAFMRLPRDQWTIGRPAINACEP
ncbi:PIN domain-containing protein [Kitasatospora sp. GP82]|uniref:PIN domain-containing protein n=1 Tax=Kitasatospora sp. GP82 TaxID=3035089 RepID=UPI002476EE1B|nr:PIN domain-containing protein [Kitasatospora sp. GP82]MDH6128804.1 putative nucleic acid-binding protein [Kitasatospora sp. GP82]